MRASVGCGEKFCNKARQSAKDASSALFMYLFGLKDPLALAFFGYLQPGRNWVRLRRRREVLAGSGAYVIPPAQADNKSPGHVLDGPKVKCQQQDHDDEVEHKAAAEQLAHNVRHNGCRAEEQMEEHGLWMPAVWVPEAKRRGEERELAA
jgi:hypothetical protein